MKPEIQADFKKILDTFTSDGAYVFGEILDEAQAKSLYDKILEQRSFSSDIFLTEEEYRNNPQHRGVNPRPGFNFIDQFEKNLTFIENDSYLRNILTNLLGENYTIFFKKFVCGIPDHFIPTWLQEILKNTPINNLGAYIKPEYRDITYFHGIDFHQDSIDWPSDNGIVDAGDLITLYVYIHPVTSQEAPLYLIPTTHKLGATLFPHNLQQKENSNIWLYSDSNGNTIEAEHKMLTGNAGYAAMWHSATLHGTQGIDNKNKKDEKMRISLRYLLCKSQTSVNTGLDLINKTISAPLFLDKARMDLDEKGKPQIKHNNINKIKP